jgi:hypothetical protein
VHRERFKTILTVTRSISSAANALSLEDEQEDDVCMAVTNDARREQAKAAARPLFFSNMCTSIVTAFLQWTGVLGRLPASPALEAIMEVFYAQLGNSESMLNPDMFNQGEKGRCVQISKARCAPRMCVCRCDVSS